MSEARSEGSTEALAHMSESDLHHAEDFLTMGRFILSGAFARCGAVRALRAAAAARGISLPSRTPVETLVKELEPPKEIAEACRTLSALPEAGLKPTERYVELCRRVAAWATRVAGS